MPRKRKEVPLSQRNVPEVVRTKARPSLAIVLGSPAEVVHCSHPQRHRSDVLPDGLASGRAPAHGVAVRRTDGEVVTPADLWDLPAEFQTCSICRRDAASAS